MIEKNVTESNDAGMQLLLSEFSHRVTNDWTSAIGVVSLTAARCKNAEAKAALADVEARLRSYAHVQNSLRMPEQNFPIEANVYLRKLCQAISHAKLESRGIELILSDFSFSMSSARCWLLGMIISELITNAARHAFASRTGSIRVEFQSGIDVLECIVTDNGIGNANSKPGLGLRIVEALTRALHGDIRTQCGPSGTSSVLSIPLDD